MVADRPVVPLPSRVGEVLSPAGSAIATALMVNGVGIVAVLELLPTKIAVTDAVQSAISDDSAGGV
jgi:hypothetical protein